MRRYAFPSSSFEVAAVTRAVDPLSDIVSLLEPHDCVAAGLDAGGDWSIRFERHAGLKCNAVLHGRCSLRVDGAEPVTLEAGDCAILPHGRAFLLSARPARSGEDARTVYAPVPHGGTAVHGGGGDFFMTGSRFLLSGTAAELLLGALPPVLVVRGGPGRTTLPWALERIADELREPGPGGALCIEHLSHLVLVQVMRRHLATSGGPGPAGRESPDPECREQGGPERGGGWLAAIADPRLSKAIAAVHEDPARSWTVAELAACADLSRTSFAVRFRRVSGQTPMAYLTRWRMLVAADRLRRTGAPIARVAEGVGYASESAFAVAFKRATGRSPRRHARGPAA